MRAYAPGNRGLWRKVKCLYREEFVVVGWTDPEGRRPYLGALLLAYYDPDGRLVYAGRAGTGIDNAELERLWRRLQPLATDKMPLDVPPPRGSRFGSPLVLSRVHWVRPELVAEVKFLTWTDDNLLRQVVYEGLREDKPAREVRREHRQGPQPVKEVPPAHGPAARNPPDAQNPEPGRRGPQGDTLSEFAGPTLTIADHRLLHGSLSRPGTPTTSRSLKRSPTQRAAVDYAIELSGFRDFLPASPAVMEGPPLASPPPGDFPGLLCSIW